MKTIFCSDSESQIKKLKLAQGGLGCLLNADLKEEFDKIEILARKHPSTGLRAGEKGKHETGSERRYL
jgi:hypothetical protein